MNIHLVDNQPVAVDTRRLASLATLVLEEEGLPSSTGVGLMLVTDEEMASLNESRMGKSGPTDVLSFPLEDLHPGAVPHRDPSGPPLELGDVVIAPAQVRRQAEEHSVDYEDELALMVVHGILHLLGYDHVSDDEAEHMERREADLLAEVGVVRP